jgi:transposase
MLNFPPAVRIWVATAPVDLRRSFDRLAAEVRDQLHNDPLSGHIFVFKNKRGDRVKLLHWDAAGRHRLGQGPARPALPPTGDGLSGLGGRAGAARRPLISPPQESNPVCHCVLSA